MSLRHKKLSVEQFFAIYFAVLVGISLIFLGLSGRLHPVFSLLGVAIPFLFRFMPWFGRGIQAFNLYKQFKNWRGPGGGNNQSPPQSEIKTRFLHMVLVHETGMMDGKVLFGQFMDAQLSSLSLEQLLELHDECLADNDSINVLEAYLDREHQDWRESSGRRSNTAHSSGEMNEQQALDILGLQPDSTRDEIVDAHRKLMQKMHPDRGGSTYLAARINEAKDFLLGKR